MVRIDCYLFGYRKIGISPEKLSSATAILLRAGIPSRFNSDGTITVRERDFQRIQGLFNGRIEYSVSKPLGLYGKIKEIKHKKAVIAGIFISLLISIFLSGLVWDIRIEGNESVPSSKIIYQLSQCGFEIGDSWRRTDKSEIESSFLMASDEISWININRRGTVAYVKVIEGKRQDNIDSDNPIKYANIVADCDCVVEEITVHKGTAAVKAGDAVKKGDILISGVLPIEAGGGFCHAEGSVIGRISDTVSVNVDREYTFTQKTGTKLYSFDINLFNFRINIFKLYGNLTNECDIIEKTKSFSLFERRRLPVSITTAHIPQYESRVAEYTDNAIVSVATERLGALMASRLSSCDLLKMKTQGDFTETGYYMKCDMVFLCQVGEDREFYVNRP